MDAPEMINYFFFEESNECSGQLVKIKIEKSSPWALQGKVEYSS